MNKTVALVKEWAAFEEKTPSGSLEDFCRQYLKQQREKETSTEALSLDEAYSCRYALSKVINRLSKLWMYFTLDVMKPMGLTSFDEFIFLYTVSQSPSIRKKDLIYMHFIEISSGILVIDRLIKKGFLSEKTGNQDKRSKQLSITQKGKETLAACHVQLDKIARELYGGMPEKEMEVCLEYLTPIENRIAEKWNQMKKFDPVAIDLN